MTILYNIIIYAAIILTICRLLYIAHKLEGIKKFLKNTWKVLLVIFIVVATLLYSLIFDGSDIPFTITFTACIVILFLKALKNLINTIRTFFYLKKSGLISGKNKNENNFWRGEFEMHIFLFLSAGWFLAELICIIL